MFYVYELEVKPHSRCVDIFHRLCWKRFFSRSFMSGPLFAIWHCALGYTKKLWPFFLMSIWKPAAFCKCQGHKAVWQQPYRCTSELKEKHFGSDWGCQHCRSLIYSVRKNLHQYRKKGRCVMFYISIFKSRCYHSQLFIASSCWSFSHLCLTNCAL